MILYFKTVYVLERQSHKKGEKSSICCFIPQIFPKNQGLDQIQVMSQEVVPVSHGEVLGSGEGPELWSAHFQGARS